MLGLGKIGTPAARLPHASGSEVTGIDTRAPAATGPHPVLTADLAAGDGLTALLRPYEAVLSCLPYALNRRIATTAHGLGLHYDPELASANLALTPHQDSRA